MSNLMEVIKSRRSTRAFKSELPPKDQIMQIVEAAEWGAFRHGQVPVALYRDLQCREVAQAAPCRC